MKEDPVMMMLMAQAQKPGGGMDATRQRSKSKDRSGALFAPPGGEKDGESK